MKDSCLAQEVFGHIPQGLADTPAFVYALLCQDGKGPLYVKVGYTTKLWNRMSGLDSACPIQARYLMTLAIPSERDAKWIEGHIHGVLKPFSLKGEWFKFNVDSIIDKRAFNAALQSARAQPMVPRSSKWRQRRKLNGKWMGPTEKARVLKKAA